MDIAMDSAITIKLTVTKFEFDALTRQFGQTVPYAGAGAEQARIVHEFYKKWAEAKDGQNR